LSSASRRPSYFLFVGAEHQQEALLSTTKRTKVFCFATNVFRKLRKMSSFSLTQMKDRLFFAMQQKDAFSESEGIFVFKQS
jgi:hypothetical protein